MTMGSVFSDAAPHDRHIVHPLTSSRNILLPSKKASLFTYNNDVVSFPITSRKHLSLLLLTPPQVKKLTSHSSTPRGEVALFIASFVPVPAACKYLNIFSGDALVIGILIPSYGSESIPYRCETSHIYTRNNKKRYKVIFVFRALVGDE